MRKTAEAEHAAEKSRRISYHTPWASRPTPDHPVYYHGQNAVPESDPIINNFDSGVIVAGLGITLVGFSVNPILGGVAAADTVAYVVWKIHKHLSQK